MYGADTTTSTDLLASSTEEGQLSTTAISETESPSTDNMQSSVSDVFTGESALR